MEKLTARQLEAFEFIKSHTEGNGFPPSLRELCQHMGYRAVGSAQDVISSLRRKGYLQTPTKQKARSLMITDKAKGHFGLQRIPAQLDEQSIDVPILGSVPAGYPVEAIQEVKGSLKVSLSLLPRPVANADRLFALQASGLSMVGAGILDGDWLIVKSLEEAPAHSIVVAQVEGEATVKRLMQDPTKGWFLQPENSDFHPIYASDQEFQVIGRVLALQRTL